MDKNCPIYHFANFMGKRWTILILTELCKGRSRWKRYSYLKGKLMEITPKVLSERLKELEKNKLVKKRIDASRFPVKSEYSLSEKGDDLVNIIREIKTWGLKWEVKNEHCEKVDCKECEI